MAYERLAKYLPQGSRDKVIDLLKQYPLQLKLVPGRKTKLGDYRPPSRNIDFHRISVNFNLNPYAFLLILLHEVAHMKVWMKYRSKVKPHGEEWKASYRALLLEYIEMGIFPRELETALKKHLIKAYASFSADMSLMKALQAYDRKPADNRLEDLAEDALFRSVDGRLFKKGGKLRTRYRCYCITNKRSYTIHPMAKIIPVEQE